QIAKRIKGHEVASALLSLPTSHKEISGFVTEPNLGILLKFRPDILNADVAIIPDVKTVTRGMGDRALWRLVEARGWILQAAWYVWCHQLLTGKRLEWAFVFVETKPPYGVRIRTVPDEMLDRALGWILPFLPEYKKHLEAD